MCARVRACVCVRACVRACARARVCVCVCVAGSGSGGWGGNRGLIILDAMRQVGYGFSQLPKWLTRKLVVY